MARNPPPDPIRPDSKLLDYFAGFGIRRGANWEMFLSRLASHPSEAAEVSESGGFALQHVIAVDAPLHVVRATFDAYPQAIERGTNSLLRLALNKGYCQKVDMENIRFLLEKCPEAVSVVDHNGYIPLHHAIIHKLGPIDLIQELIQVGWDRQVGGPRGGGGTLQLLESRNEAPRLPLEVICSQWEHYLRLKKFTSGEFTVVDANPAGPDGGIVAFWERLGVVAPAAYSAQLGSDTILPNPVLCSVIGSELDHSPLIKLIIRHHPEEVNKKDHLGRTPLQIAMTSFGTTNPSLIAMLRRAEEASTNKHPFVVSGERLISLGEDIAVIALGEALVRAGNEWTLALDWEDVKSACIDVIRAREDFRDSIGYPKNLAYARATGPTGVCANLLDLQRSFNGMADETNINEFRVFAEACGKLAHKIKQSEEF